MSVEAKRLNNFDYDEDENIYEIEHSKNNYNIKDKNLNNYSNNKLISSENSINNIANESYKSISENSYKLNESYNNEDQSDIEVGIRIEKDNIFEEQTIDNEYKQRNDLAEFLYNSQKIGKYTDENKLIYEKHQFCELSLKDIHRTLRKEDPEDPKLKLQLIRWKVIQNDILPLIVNYKDNEKIQQLCIVILVDVTEELKDVCVNRDIINQELTTIQTIFAEDNKFKIIEHLSVLLESSTEKIKLANDIKTELYNDKKILSKNIFQASSYQKELNEFVKDLSNNSKFDNINNTNFNLNDYINHFNLSNNTCIKTQGEIDNINKELAKKQDELDIKSKEVADIEEKYQAMIELIFVLFKQILNIYNYTTIKINNRNFFNILKKFSKRNIFEAVIHYSKDTESQFGQKLSLTLLELICYILRPFNAYDVVNSEFDFIDNYQEDMYNNVNTSNNKSISINKNNSSLLNKLREEEKIEKEERFMKYSNRQSNFGSMYNIKRPTNDSSYIVKSFNKLNNNKMLNEIKNQKHKPIKKLINKINNKNILTFTNALRLGEEIKFVNDLMIIENIDKNLIIEELVHIENSNSNLKDEMKEKENLLLKIKIFVTNFIDKCFNEFARHYQILIISADNNKSNKIDKNELANLTEKYDYYNFVNLTYFILEFFRYNSYKNQDIQRKKFKNNKLNIPFIFKNISAAFNKSFLQKIYEYALRNSDEKNYHQSSVSKRYFINKDSNTRKSFDLYASLNLIKILFLISLDAYKSKSDINLELSVIIQDNLLANDYSKIFKNMFILFKEEYYSISLLKSLVELTDIYFTTLNYFSEKRNMTIKCIKLKNVNTLTKTKYNDINSNDECNDKYDIDTDDLSSENNYVAKHRIIDITKEVETILIDYEVILKILKLIYKDETFVKPSDNYSSVLKYIKNLFDRIINTNNEWIFFNIEILNILQITLNSSTFYNYSKLNSNFYEIYKQFKHIIKIFFEKMLENKLLGIECLFRFNSAIVKNSILNNYNENEYNYNNFNDSKIKDQISCSEENSIYEYKDSNTKLFDGYDKIDIKPKKNKNSKLKISNNNNEIKDITTQNNYIDNNHNQKYINRNYNNKLSINRKDNSFISNTNINNHNKLKKSSFWSKDEDIILLNTLIDLLKNSFSENNEIDLLFNEDLIINLTDAFKTKNIDIVTERSKTYINILKNMYQKEDSNTKNKSRDSLFSNLKSKIMKKVNKMYQSTTDLEEEKEKRRSKKILKQRLTEIILEITDECVHKESFKHSIFLNIDSLISSLKTFLNQFILSECNNEILHTYSYIIDSDDKLKAFNNNFQAFLSNIGFYEIKEIINLNCNDICDNSYDINENDYLIKWKLSPNIKNDVDLSILIEKLIKFKQTIYDNLDIMVNNEFRNNEKEEAIKKIIPQLKVIEDSNNNNNNNCNNSNNKNTIDNIYQNYNFNENKDNKNIFKVNDNFDKEDELERPYILSQENI